MFHQIAYVLNVGLEILSNSVMVIGVKLAEIFGLDKVLAWYSRKCIKDGRCTTDDFINIAVIGQIKRLQRASDEELEKLLNSLRNRAPEDTKTVEKYFPSPQPQAIDKFCEAIISEIEGTLFLREHKRRYKEVK